MNFCLLSTYSQIHPIPCYDWTFRTARNSHTDRMFYSSLVLCEKWVQSCTIKHQVYTLYDCVSLIRTEHDGCKVRQLLASRKKGLCTVEFMFIQASCLLLHTGTPAIFNKMNAITTGNPVFAECPRHSTKGPNTLSKGQHHWTMWLLLGTSVAQ